MRTRKLDPVEIRVLGALMEKEQTTPDNYPLTINAVIAACNQKSNRSPVTQLSETEVVEALDRLREDVLTWRSEGARAERWEHRLERRLGLDPGKKAVLCLLMLRGPQTAGELKGRSERMHAFADAAEVEQTLASLAEGFDALVEELPRQPGQRENRWSHLMLADEFVSEEPEPPAATPTPRPAPRPEAEEDRGPDAMERLAAVEAKLEELEALAGRVGNLEDELLALRRRLGDV